MAFEEISTQGTTQDPIQDSVDSITSRIDDLELSEKTKEVGGDTILDSAKNVEEQILLHHIPNKYFYDRSTPSYTDQDLKKYTQQQLQRGATGRGFFQIM